jgi:phospholipid/cholesterol/gamma-HCH transport system permease protein
MKVREEIDALITMGLEPVRFLVVPRVLAAVSMTPILSLFANLFGLIGGALVMVSLGFPLITYINQILSTGASLRTALRSPWKSGGKRFSFT